MNKNSHIIMSFIAVLFFVTACSNQAQVVENTAIPTAEPTPTQEVESRKITMLFSYEQDFWASADEDSGIVEGLASQGYVEGENLEITRLYMDTKTVNKTQEDMNKVALEMVEEITSDGSDLLILMDDNALQHVGAKLLDTELPVVFAGINASPTDEGYGKVDLEKTISLADSMEQPGHNITGVLERISLTAGFELLKKVMPDAETALFISDNSAVTNLLMGSGGKDELETVALEVVEQVYTNEFEVLKSTILDYQDKVDAIVLFLPWTIEDEDGNPVPQDQVVRWFVQNSSLPSIGFVDVLPTEGYLSGVVVDMNQQGFHAGLMGGRILNGESPAEMPIIDPVANRILINLARADQLGIEISFELLQSADEVFQEMSVYPEYEMSSSEG